MAWLSIAQSAQSSEGANVNMVYEVGELFELGIKAVLSVHTTRPAGSWYIFLSSVRFWSAESLIFLPKSCRCTMPWESATSEIKKLDRAIQQFEKAVELQPGYVTAWNNLGDAYEQKKDLKSALKAFEEVLLFDPNNKVARPRRDDLRQRLSMYKGVPVKSEK